MNKEKNHDPGETSASDDSSQTELPAISIGVVTHERAGAFGKLLEWLIPAINNYGGACELVVANNSGESAHSLVERIVDQSGIRTTCPVRIIDSPENSITIGRNVVLDHTQYQYLAFIDDDEYPVKTWLSELMGTMRRFDCPMVAGPIIPVFPAEALHWIRTVDVHNLRGLATGDRIQFCATGNFLIDRNALGSDRFDAAYGHTGGGDTEFFLRLGDRGLLLRWCSEAIVYEDIPANKSTVHYILRRCMNQGANYRTILQRRGSIRSSLFFSARALLTFLVSLPIGLLLMCIRHRDTGLWMKRAFSNLGKLYRPRQQLYGSQ